jgi:hypothetical protein
MPLVAGAGPPQEGLPVFAGKWLIWSGIVDPGGRLPVQGQLPSACATVFVWSGARFRIGYRKRSKNASKR